LSQIPNGPIFLTVKTVGNQEGSVKQQMLGLGQGDCHIDKQERLEWKE
jgi:hypothetical protein